MLKVPLENMLLTKPKHTEPWELTQTKTASDWHCGWQVWGQRSLCLKEKCPMGSASQLLAVGIPHRLHQRCPVDSCWVGASWPLCWLSSHRPSGQCLKGRFPFYVHLSCSVFNPPGIWKQSVRREVTHTAVSKHPRGCPATLSLASPGPLWQRCLYSAKAIITLLCTSMARS
jgi:hypothetical protein